MLSSSWSSYRIKQLLLQNEKKESNMLREKRWALHTEPELQEVIVADTLDL